jgi:hypothetical protein
MIKAHYEVAHGWRNE